MRSTFRLFGKRGPGRPADTDVRVFRHVFHFAVTGLIGLVVVGVAGGVLLGRASSDESLRNATSVTVAVGRGVIEPALTPALLRGDPQAIDHMNDLVRERVPATFLRVKVWSAAGGQGRVAYANEPRLIGRSFPLEHDIVSVLESGQPVAASKADLSDPENVYEQNLGNVFEVYVPLRAATGERVVFESYQAGAAVATARRRLLETYLPAALGALVLLWLIQLPLAYRLARRLQARSVERERLLRRAVDASDIERRRLASDLHDGVVQDLAGVQFALEGTANQARGLGAADLEEQLRDAAHDTRQSLRRMRSLLVEIHPPNLQNVGLEAALTDLVAPLTARGMAVSLSVPDDLEVGGDAEKLIFRAAQEGVRNIANHADARSVELEVSQMNGSARLVVRDDGRGFSRGERDAREAEGHVGLQLLGEIAAEARGRLQVDSAPGKGTKLTLEVPPR